MRPKAALTTDQISSVTFLLQANDNPITHNTHKCQVKVGSMSPSPYLGDLAEAGGVDGSVLGGDGHCVPALVLGKVTAAWGVRTSAASGTTSAHPAPWASTRLLL